MGKVIDKIRSKVTKSSLGRRFMLTPEEITNIHRLEGKLRKDVRERYARGYRSYDGILKERVLKGELTPDPLRKQIAKTKIYDSKLSAKTIREIVRVVEFFKKHSKEPTREKFFKEMKGSLFTSPDRGYQGMRLHFEAQPLQHTQRINALLKEKEVRDREEAGYALLEHSEGTSLSELAVESGKSKETKEWLDRHREEIVNQFAEIMADHVSFGLVHNDVAGRNIIVSKSKNGKPLLTMIDYNLAERAEDVGLKGFKEDYNGFLTEIHYNVALQDDKKSEELKELFRKKLEKKLEEKLGA